MQIYPKKLILPKSIPAGRILAHNHVVHTLRTRSGTRGFRWWTWRQDEVPGNFESCPCGWSGLPHVANKHHVAWQRERITQKN